MIGIQREISKKISDDFDGTQKSNQWQFQSGFVKKAQEKLGSFIQP